MAARELSLSQVEDQTQLTQEEVEKIDLDAYTQVRVRPHTLASGWQAGSGRQLRRSDQILLAEHKRQRAEQDLERAERERVEAQQERDHYKEMVRAMKESQDAFMTELRNRQLWEHQRQFGTQNNAPPPPYFAGASSSGQQPAPYPPPPPSDIFDVFRLPRDPEDQDPNIGDDYDFFKVCNHLILLFVFLILIRSFLNCKKFNHF